jgi:hypothetical protein
MTTNAQFICFVNFALCLLNYERKQDQTNINPFRFIKTIFHKKKKSMTKWCNCFLKAEQALYKTCRDKWNSSSLRIQKTDCWYIYCNDCRSKSNWLHNPNDESNKINLQILFFQSNDNIVFWKQNLKKCFLSILDTFDFYFRTVKLNIINLEWKCGQAFNLSNSLHANILQHCSCE